MAIHRVSSRYPFLHSFMRCCSRSHLVRYCVRPVWLKIPLSDAAASPASRAKIQNR
ncbi:hypothetical protein [Microcoleus sp. FACHB-831]|uniref:hypothetical protein n=1 Tax=Microcoleus sp. FACHB-831 TaxID=2692827 RepID=UPI00168A18DE|nr:hypothetical protein [Microcoleus sp. FACHB-831]